MKKILFLLLLLIPFMVKAEVKITSVELVDNTKNLEVEKNPSFKDLTINFNLKFANTNEFVKYKAIIKNDTNKDYEIEDGEKFNEGKFIKYDFALDNKDNKVIKAGEERTMFITITYIKEVSPELFKDGKYVETNEMTVNLSNDDKEAANPKTEIGDFLKIIGILMLVAFILALLSKYQLSKLVVLLIAIAIPITIYALEKITIKMEASIEIIEPPKKELTTQYSHCGYYDDATQTYYRSGSVELKFLEGMTWEEFYESEYANTLNPNLLSLMKRKNYLVNKELYYCERNSTNIDECIELNVKEVQLTDLIQYEGYEYSESNRGNECK